MRKRITYEEMIKNRRLTDFDGIKDIVIVNQVKKLPCNEKKDKTNSIQLNYI